jgi:hypothetical protein
MGSSGAARGWCMVVSRALQVSEASAAKEAEAD